MPVHTREVSEIEARHLARAVNVLLRIHGSRDAAADRVGIAHGTLTALASGRPGAYYPRSLEAVAGAVGCSMEQLLAGRHGLATCGANRQPVTPAPPAAIVVQCCAA